MPSMRFIRFRCGKRCSRPTEPRPGECSLDEEVPLVRYAVLKWRSNLLALRRPGAEGSAPTAIFRNVVPEAITVRRTDSTVRQLLGSAGETVGAVVNALAKYPLLLAGR